VQGSSSPLVTMMRTASSIWPSGSAGASSSASFLSTSSGSALASPVSHPSGRSSSRKAPAKGGRLTSFRGSRTTGWRVSPGVLAMGAEEIEATPGVDDEDPRTVHRAPIQGA
jgi:hypothetical protein